MPKKAPRRNGFFYFMLNFKKREEAKGAVFPNGFKEVSVFADDEWRNLSPRQKEVYHEQARKYNQSEYRNQGIKTNLAKPSRLIRVPPSSEMKKVEEKELIKRMIDKLNIDELLDYPFYLIHVNVYCITNDEECCPAELAISQFTLREGVLKVFHRFLNPGKIPMGYSHEVNQHIEKTHKIPLDHQKSNSGFLGIYSKILKFLKEDGSEKDVPQLYTFFDDPFHNCSLKGVKLTLKKIWETINVEEEEEGEVEDCEGYEEIFKVYSLRDLFFFLKNKIAKVLNSKGFENDYLAIQELLKDPYSYDVDIACQYHQQIDTVQFCSQSYTVRWARVIQENCCIGLLEADSDEDDENEVKAEAPVAIKSEREIKKEKDLTYGHVKSEKDSNCSVKKEKDTSHPIKEEKDHGRSIKTEKEQNPIPSTSIKTERNEPSVRIKVEPPVKIETEKLDSAVSPTSCKENTSKEVKTELHSSIDIKSEKLDSLPSNNISDRIPTPPPAPIIRPKSKPGISAIRTDKEAPTVRIETEPSTSSNREKTPPPSTIRIKTEPSSSSNREKTPPPPTIRIKTEPEQPMRIYSERAKTPPSNRDPRLRARGDAQENRDPRLRSNLSRDPRVQNPMTNSSFEIPAPLSTVPLVDIKVEKDADAVVENNKRASCTDNISDNIKKRRTLEEPVVIKNEPIHFDDEIKELKHEECDLGYDFIPSYTKKERKTNSLVESMQVDEVSSESSENAAVKNERNVIKVEKECIKIKEEVVSEEDDYDKIEMKDELFTSQVDLD